LVAGPVECVNVEHEEVLLMPRWVKAKRVTLRYGLFALELLAAGTWSGAGVLGPEAFDAVPFLDLLAGDYASPWGLTECRHLSGLWRAERLASLGELAYER
jgi:hypothetical protein